MTKANRGSRVNIWKQDRRVPHTGIRTVFIHTPIEDGPRDEYFKVSMNGMTPAKADKRGDFLYDRKNNPEQFDAVHTFAVARIVLTMYQRALNRLGRADALPWPDNRGPIALTPRYRRNLSAFYSREEWSIFFNSFWHDEGNGRRTLIYTCQSFDLVAHESGHAVFDALKPGYYETKKLSSETEALWESFGDLTAIFAMLTQMDQAETLIAYSKIDLQRTSFLSEIAEEYGFTAYERHFGVRNAANHYRADQYFPNNHERSQVFTGAIYYILTAFFQDQMDLQKYDPAETLARTGRYVLDLVLSAFLDGPNENATFLDIGNELLKKETNTARRQVIEQELKNRRIILTHRP